MNLFTFLADIFLSDVKNLIKLAKVLKTQPKRLLLLLNKDPQAFAEELGKLTPRARKAFSKSITTAQNATGVRVDTALLSSSAISAGT